VASPKIPPEKLFIDDFALIEEEPEKAWTDSPWFWVGVGVLSGTLGYVIYSQTTTKSVATP
jgi:hypothetical protein